MWLFHVPCRFFLRSLHLYHSFNAHQVLSIRIAHLFNNGPKPLLELEQLFSSSTYREQRERCRVNANNCVTHDDTTTSHQHGMTYEITSCQTIWYLTASHRTWHKNRRNVIWLNNILCLEMTPHFKWRDRRQFDYYFQISPISWNQVWLMKPHGVTS